jgi:hypothetical protein
MEGLTTDQKGELMISQIMPCTGGRAKKVVPALQITE